MSLRTRCDIEFHDSTIEEIAQEGTSLRLGVEAYVHRWEMVAGIWKGTGWWQPVKIVLSGGTCPSGLRLPAELDGGEIRADGVTYSHMVPLPLTLSGPVTLQLELMTGEIVEASGLDIVIEPAGPAVYCENLPDDFNPGFQT